MERNISEIYFKIRRYIFGFFFLKLMCGSLIHIFDVFYCASEDKFFKFDDVIVFLG